MLWADCNWERSGVARRFLFMEQATESDISLTHTAIVGRRVRWLGHSELEDDYGTNRSDG